MFDCPNVFFKRILLHKGCSRTMPPLNWLLLLLLLLQVWHLNKGSMSIESFPLTLCRFTIVNPTRTLSAVSCALAEYRAEHPEQRPAQGRMLCCSTSQWPARYPWRLWLLPLQGIEESTLSIIGNYVWRHSNAQDFHSTSEALSSEVWLCHY